MLTVLRANERGLAQTEWLTSYHSFSFGDYYNPQQMGFHTLRVINQDYVKPGTGFPLHAHRNMEIITYVIKGAIAHKDSLGHEEIIHPGEIQCMTAGAGIQHSEYNPSTTEELELLQIWILPAARELKPSYRTIAFTKQVNDLQLLASGDNNSTTLHINQNVNLFVGLLEPQREITYETNANNHIWLQIIKGQIIVNGQLLNPGDGLGVTETSKLTITAPETTAEFLLFDLKHAE